MKDISFRVKASERSVRYDLDQVEAWLREHGLRLRRKPRVGVWVEGSREARSRALAMLGEPDRLRVLMEPEDRSWLMLGWILCSRSPVPVRTLAAALGVSRRTVYYDLQRLSSWLRSRGLCLRRGRRGVSLEGDEVQCRSVMVEFLERYVGNDDLVKVTTTPVLGSSAQSPSRADSVAGQWLWHLLREIGDPEAMAKINAIVNNVLRAFGLRLATSLRGALVAHLLATVVRVKQGRASHEQREQLARLRQRPEWTVASRIARALEESFGISLPTPEVGYIALYLGSQVTGIDAGSGWFAPSQEELGLCARVIAEEAGSYLGVNLMQDVELRSGLVAHLYASLEKIRAGMPVRNPLLDEIRARYPIIHSAVRNACRRAGAVVGVEIPDEEAGWIALHIGAALERLRQRTKRWKGVVVCGSGVGTAHLVRARLLCEFPNAEFKVLGAVDEEYLWTWVSQNGADVVISTVELRPGVVPVVVVSPFLTTSDVRKIASVVYARATLTEADLLGGCHARAALQAEESHEQQLVGPPLQDLIDERRIRVGVRASNAVEAIRFAGELLRVDGIVSGKYVDAMVNLYLQLGAYMVVARGVALPHASPEDGALGLGVAVVTLERPINFGSPENDPVRIVISFALPDYSSHLRALSELLQMLGQGVGDRVYACNTAAEVASVLRV
ncbi:MAG: PRD domain-containing protein [Firmicutes bacterium]|nr:PRD domain-containing protein [Candidatus Fermentithermobacillaceae bacterium]